MRLFGQTAENISLYFADLRNDLKRAKMRLSLQEYLSLSILTSVIIFLFELPLLAFILAFFLKSFLFSFITSFTISIFLTVLFFLAHINYPKVMINERSKQIENDLPFATLYLSTLSGSKLSLNRIFNIFAKFGKYGEITDEINRITKDMHVFGIDVNTALERAVERSPSKNFKELLWGILSVSRSGGNLDKYLKEKSKSLIAEHRRRLFEFSHQLIIFIEVYLTAIVLGAIFFTILTSIMGGVAGASSDIVVVQFLLIFIFIPGVSAAFVVLVKSAIPGGE